MVIHEAPRSFGPGAEVVSRLMEKAFYYLEAPIERVTGFDIIIPLFSREKAYLPGTERILRAGRKVLAQYLCEAIPFSGVPPNTIVVVAITEAESNEAISAAMYPMMLAGATVHMVPVLEMPVGGAAETEKQYRA